MLAVDAENGEMYSLSNKLTFHSTVLRSINPVNSIDDDFYQLSSLVYESLVYLDDTLEPQPQLAESWEFEDGGKSIVFTIGSGHKFSDGSEVKAEDVVYSFNAIKNSSESAYRSKMNHISNAEVTGSNGVRFYLSDGCSASPAYFNFPVVSSSQFSSLSELIANKETPVMGSGLYRIDKADLKNSINLLPNQNHAKQVADNIISVKLDPVVNPYIGFVIAGDISICIDKDVDREAMAGENGLDIVEFTSNEAEVCGFNCASGVFVDSLVRQAAAYIIDRDAIIGAAYYNSGTKSDDLYFPGYYGTAITDKYMPDETKAKALLEKAELKDTDGDGILENAAGVKATVNLLVNADNVSRTTAADLIATDLRKYGFSVTVNQVSNEAILPAISSGSFDIFIGGWKISEEFDLTGFYASGGATNYARYSNAALDRNLTALQSGLDADSYREKLVASKEIIADDMPYLCLMFKTYAAASTSNLEGLVAPRFNSYYYGCGDWKIREYEREEDGDNQG